MVGGDLQAMITEMERGFAGHCPFVSFFDLYASAYDDYHVGRFREAFDQFARIEAASTMFARSDVNPHAAAPVRFVATAVRMAPNDNTVLHLIYNVVYDPNICSGWLGGIAERRHRAG